MPNELRSMCTHCGLPENYNLSHFLIIFAAETKKSGKGNNRSKTFLEELEEMPGMKFNWILPEKKFGGGGEGNAVV